MELFKSVELKNEFKELTETLLPKIMECSYCNKLSCMYHSKFDVTCIHCKKIKCINCFKFNISKNILLDASSEETKDYLVNYIRDFLNIRETSIEHFFPEIKIVKKEKIKFKKKVKSEKNRSQIVNQHLPAGLREGTFRNGRWERRFYY